MAAVPAPERKRLPDGGADRTLRGQSNRMAVTPASSTALSAASEESARNLVFDHRRSFAAPRRRRTRSGWFWFLIIVLLPVSAAAYYYFLVAADQYVSEFRFALRSAEPERHDPTLFLP
jgi:hypothetical protein